MIITSRIADWSTAVQTAELDVLAEEDASEAAPQTGEAYPAVDRDGCRTAGFSRLAYGGTEDLMRILERQDQGEVNGETPE